MTPSNVSLPITMIGGPLGAGKTTLINSILDGAVGTRIAVLVNDVGSVGIDAALIASVTDGVIELSNGCVCCSISEGLGPALDQVRARADRIDAVVLELSGVAKPRVVPWAATSGFSLASILVCVDVERIEQQRHDRWMSDTITDQLAAADLFVLTKTDLVEPARLASVTDDLTNAHPDTPILQAPDTGLAELLIDRERPAHLRSTTAVEDEPVQWSVASVRTPDPLVADRLASALRDLDQRVIRIKGLMPDSEGRTLLVQGVGSRRTVEVQDLEPRPEPGLVAIAAPTLPAAELKGLLEALVARTTA